MLQSTKVSISNSTERYRSVAAATGAATSGERACDNQRKVPKQQHTTTNRKSSTATINNDRITVGRLNTHNCDTIDNQR